MNRIRLLQRILKKTASKEVWFHATKPENLKAILENGLKVGQTRNFTDANSKLDMMYGGIMPIFVANITGYEGISLEVLVDPSKLMVDIGELLSYTETDITPEYIEFHYPQAVKVLHPYLKDYRITFNELFNNKKLIKEVIAEHHTAAYPENIPPEDIVNRDALIQQLKENKI